MLLDDIIIDYDDFILSFEIDEMWSNEGKNQSGCTITASPIADGPSSVVVVSSYDYEADGENAVGYEVKIAALNSRDGRKVYC